MIEQLPLLDLTNAGLTFLLVLEVASMKQAMKQADEIEYQNPPLINYFKGIKP